MSFEGNFTSNLAEMSIQELERKSQKIGVHRTIFSTKKTDTKINVLKDSETGDSCGTPSQVNPSELVEMMKKVHVMEENLYFTESEPSVCQDLPYGGKPIKRTKVQQESKKVAQKRKFNPNEIEDFLNDSITNLHKSIYGEKSNDLKGKSHSSTGPQKKFTFKNRNSRFSLTKENVERNHILSEVRNDLFRFKSKMLPPSRAEIYETSSNKTINSNVTKDSVDETKLKIENNQNIFLLENVNDSKNVDQLSLLKMKYVKLVGIPGFSDTNKKTGKSESNTRKCHNKNSSYEHNRHDSEPRAKTAFTDKINVLKNKLNTILDREGFPIYHSIDSEERIDENDSSMPNNVSNNSKTEESSVDVEEKSEQENKCEDILLNPAGKPVILFNKAGFPLTDSKGRCLKNNLGIKMLPVMSYNEIVGNKKLQVFDAFNLPPTSMTFDPSRVPPPSTQHDIKITDKTGKPTVLYNSLGFPLSGPDGYILRNNQGNFLIVLDSVGIPMCCLNGEPIYMEEGKLWIIEKHLYDVLHQGIQNNKFTIVDDRSEMDQMSLNSRINELINCDKIHDSNENQFNPNLNKTSLHNEEIRKCVANALHKSTLVDINALQQEIENISESLHSMNCSRGNNGLTSNENEHQLLEEQANSDPSEDFYPQPDKSTNFFNILGIKNSNLEPNVPNCKKATEQNTVKQEYYNSGPFCGEKAGTDRDVYTVLTKPNNIISQTQPEFGPPYQHYQKQNNTNGPQFVNPIHHRKEHPDKFCKQPNHFDSSQNREYDHIYRQVHPQFRQRCCTPEEISINISYVNKLRKARQELNCAYGNLGDNNRQFLQYDPYGYSEPMVKASRSEAMLDDRPSTYINRYDINENSNEFFDAVNVNIYDR